MLDKTNRIDKYFADNKKAKKEWTEFNKKINKIIPKMYCFKCKKECIPCHHWIIFQMIVDDSPAIFQILIKKEKSRCEKCIHLKPNIKSSIRDGLSIINKHYPKAILLDTIVSHTNSEDEYEEKKKFIQDKFMKQLIDKLTGEENNQ